MKKRYIVVSELTWAEWPIRTKYERYGFIVTYLYRGSFQFKNDFNIDYDKYDQGEFYWAMQLACNLKELVDSTVLTTEAALVDRILTTIQTAIEHWFEIPLTNTKLLRLWTAYLPILQDPGCSQFPRSALDKSVYEHLINVLSILHDMPYVIKSLSAFGNPPIDYIGPDFQEASFFETLEALVRGCCLRCLVSAPIEESEMRVTPILAPQFNLSQFPGFKYAERTELLIPGMTQLSMEKRNPPDIVAEVSSRLGGTTNDYVYLESLHY